MRTKKKRELVPAQWMSYIKWMKIKKNWMMQYRFSTGLDGYKIKQAMGRNPHLIHHHLLGDKGTSKVVPTKFYCTIFHSERVLNYLQFLLARYGQVHIIPNTKQNQPVLYLHFSYFIGFELKGIAGNSSDLHAACMTVDRCEWIDVHLCECHEVKCNVKEYPPNPSLFFVEPL